MAEPDAFMRRLGRGLGEHAQRLFRLEQDLSELGLTNMSLVARDMAREAQGLVFGLYPDEDTAIGTPYLNMVADALDGHARQLHRFGTVLHRLGLTAYSRLCDRLSMEAVKLAAHIQDRTPTLQ